MNVIPWLLSIVSPTMSVMNPALRSKAEADVITKLIELMAKLGLSFTKQFQALSNTTNYVLYPYVRITIINYEKN